MILGNKVRLEPNIEQDMAFRRFGGTDYTVPITVDTEDFRHPQ